MAINWGIEKHRVHLLGVKFTVVTDHLALTWLKSKKDVQGRLMRWANKLQPCHLNVVYKSGKHHRDADYVSRLNINVMRYGSRGTYNRWTRDAYTTDAGEELFKNLDLEWIIRDAQRKDSECNQIRDNISIKENRRFAIEDDLLVYLDTHDGRAGSVAKVLVPDAALHQVLYSLHDDPMSGHSETWKTIERFRQHYYAKNAISKIKEYVRTCHLCQTRKQSWTRKFGLLQPFKPAERPFERIRIDTIGTFIRRDKGNEKIIVVTDYTTRWAIARAVSRENASEVANLLIHEVILKHGAPEVIISDRGKSFRKDILKEIYNEFEISHVRSTA